MYLKAAVYKLAAALGLLMACLLLLRPAQAQPLSPAQERKIDESILRFIKSQPVVLKWNQKSIRITKAFHEDIAENCEYTSWITKGHWADKVRADTQLNFLEHNSTWKPHSWSVPDSEIVFLFGARRTQVVPAIIQYLNSQIRLDATLTMYRQSFDPTSFREYRVNPSESYYYDYFYLARGQSLKRIFVGVASGRFANPAAQGQGCPFSGLTDKLLSYPGFSYSSFDKEVLAAAIHFWAIAQTRATRMLYSIDTSNLESTLSICKALEEKMNPAPRPSICVE